MKTNEDLQRDVMDAIKWEPLLNAAEIGVTVKDGVVTLTGVVDNYLKKIEAEEAAMNVRGVKAIVEKIEVEFNESDKVTDNKLADEVIESLRWNWRFSNDKVQAKVEDGVITLSGLLNWNYQREDAQKIVSNILGVKGVINNIVVKSEKNDAIEKHSIELALKRNWAIDDEKIQVMVVGSHVTLNGSVHSIYQKKKAEQLAWNAPGVLGISNNLSVDYNF